MIIVAGLDLAGSPRRPTGYAVARDGVLEKYGVAYGDDEILAAVAGSRIVAVDAPLLGERMEPKGFRDVDRLLAERGLRLLPLGLPGMRMLVERAKRIQRLLEEKGTTVVETHPRSAWLNSGCPGPLTAACRILVCSPMLFRERLRSDVVDAIVAAAVAHAYAIGSAECVVGAEGAICLLPRRLC